MVCFSSRELRPVQQSGRLAGGGWKLVPLAFPVSYPVSTFGMARLSGDRRSIPKIRKVAIFASEGSLLAFKSHYLWIGSLYDRNTQHLGFWDPEREKNKAKW